jgi:ribosomal protein S18 acetylase RimI-like enzyme
MSTATAHRPYRSADDYTRMLQLHRDVYGIVRGPICCTAGELEWWRFQENDPDGEIASADLWETRDGRLVAYAWPGPTYMNLMVHPGHRHLLEPILAWAEDRVRSRATQASGLMEMTTEAVDSDSEHVAVLKRRGYEPTGHSRDWRIRSLDRAIPAFDLRAGYSIRQLAGLDELEQRAALAEHPYAVHLARSPTYRPELNLAVVAPDGRLAAFSTAWLDEQNGLGVFEPVECLPGFRRLGLTRAMMCEGLRRLRRLGASEVCIVNRTENIPAARLYESLGFRAIGRISEWRKPIP